MPQTLESLTCCLPLAHTLDIVVRVDSTAAVEHAIVTALQQCAVARVEIEVWVE